MKKTVVGILMGSLVVSGSAYAEEIGASEIVSPSSEVYETIRLMEEAEYNLTADPTEKALLQDEYADKRLAEAEVALEENDEVTAERVLGDLQGHVGELEAVIETPPANPEEQVSGSSSIEDLLRANFAKRSERLRALLERDDLPAQAKTGITKAIEKHEQSAERAIARIKDKLAKGIDAKDSIEEAEDAIEDVEDAIEEEEEAAEKVAKQAEKFTKKAKKEEEKAAEKAEKEEEKTKEAAERAAEKAEKEEEKAKEAAERAAEKAEKEEEKAKEAAERAAEKAEKEEERAKEAAERAAEKAEKEEERAKEAAERAAEKAEIEEEKAAKKAAKDSKKSKEDDDNDEEDEN